MAEPKKRNPLKSFVLWMAVLNFILVLVFFKQQGAERNIAYQLGRGEAYVHADWANNYLGAALACAGNAIILFVGWIAQSAGVNVRVDKE